ncbi:hypothetical protein IFU40_13085 [Microbacterium sp. CFBP 13617]|uniref:hypothetical protein n=1 Tax=Microbacterium sp. CFBP 13617 TaxID=2774035 RepID=UPI0017858A6D|nr:hypothetical protein [Microbacterium sp. CFBP 13617]MBD8219568.1 hypothetical protein [Microbacterium sp. CFBP 13617]
MLAGRPTPPPRPEMNVPRLCFAIPREPSRFPVARTKEEHHHGAGHHHPGRQHRIHVPQACDAQLVGDVAVVGLTDDEGESTELPDNLRQRLLEPGVYRVRTRELGRSRWHEEPINRDDYVETVIWAALLQEMSPGLEVHIERVDGVVGESNQP